MTMFREYEFNFNGFDFVSSVDVEHPFYQRIKNLPEGLFVKMNLDILSSMFSKDKTYTREDIHAELDRFNAGGTYAFIQLGDN